MADIHIRGYDETGIAVLSALKSVRTLEDAATRASRAIIDVTLNAEQYMVRLGNAVDATKAKAKEMYAEVQKLAGQTNFGVDALQSAMRDFAARTGVRGNLSAVFGDIAKAANIAEVDLGRMTAVGAVAMRNLKLPIGEVGKLMLGLATTFGDSTKHVIDSLESIFESMQQLNLTGPQNLKELGTGIADLTRAMGSAEAATRVYGQIMAGLANPTSKMAASFGMLLLAQQREKFGVDELLTRYMALAKQYHVLDLDMMGRVAAAERGVPPEVVLGMVKLDKYLASITPEERKRFAEEDEARQKQTKLEENTLQQLKTMGMGLAGVAVEIGNLIAVINKLLGMPGMSAYVDSLKNLVTVVQEINKIISGAEVNWRKLLILLGVPAAMLPSKASTGVAGAAGGAVEGAGAGKVGAAAGAGGVGGATGAGGAEVGEGAGAVAPDEDEYQGKTALDVLSMLSPGTLAGKLIAENTIQLLKIIGILKRDNANNDSAKAKGMAFTPGAGEAATPATAKVTLAGLRPTIIGGGGPGRPRPNVRVADATFDLGGGLRLAARESDERQGRVVIPGADNRDYVTSPTDSVMVVRPQTGVGQSILGHRYPTATERAADELISMTGLHEQKHTERLRTYLKGSQEQVANMSPADYAWCATTVEAALKRQDIDTKGIDPSAHSILSAGKEIPAEQARKGDLFVQRGKSPRTKVEGVHTGIITGGMDKGEIPTISGNARDLEHPEPQAPGEGRIIGPKSYDPKAIHVIRMPESRFHDRIPSWVMRPREQVRGEQARGEQTVETAQRFKSEPDTDLDLPTSAGKEAATMDIYTGDVNRVEGGVLQPKNTLSSFQPSGAIGYGEERWKRLPSADIEDVRDEPTLPDLRTQRETFRQRRRGPRTGMVEPTSPLAKAAGIEDVGEGLQEEGVAEGIADLAPARARARAQPADTVKAIDLRPGARSQHRAQKNIAVDDKKTLNQPMASR